MKNWLAWVALCGSLMTIPQCGDNTNSKAILPTSSNLTEEVIDNTRNNVLFTIDDGPSEYTSDIAKTLDSLEYKWIFFVVTRSVRESTKQNLIEILKWGHSIGNHSYDHSNFQTLNIDKAKEQILVSDSIIASIYEEAGIQRDKKYIRYPYGNQPPKYYRDEFNKFLDSLWYEMPMFWHMDVDLLDFRQKPIQQSIDRMKDWDTILLHERPWTKETIKDIVRSIDSKKAI